EGGGLLTHDASLAPASASPPLFAPQRYDLPMPLPGSAEFTPLFRRDTSVVQPPRYAQSAAIPSSSTTIEVEEAPAPNLGDLRGRVIGQYRLSYILVDTPGGLRLVDQHVAHERVLYDRYWSRLGEAAPATQQLLAPILFECSAAECAVLESHVPELRAVGFDVERFSGNSFAISAVPPELVRADVDKFLRKLIDASIDVRGSHVTAAREKICASLACQAAIKVHRLLV